MRTSFGLDRLSALLLLTENREDSAKFFWYWRWRQSLNILVASTFFGSLYPVFGDGFGSVIPFINGFLIGLLGGIAISAFEMFLFPAFKRKLRFIEFVLLKSVSYSLVITFFVFAVILISRSLQFGMGIVEMYNSAAFQHFLYEEDFFIIVVYALVLAVLVIFTKELNYKMGQGVLFNFITGRYRKPRKEKRIFMFLDMNSSVSKAESLGNMEYHNLLNEFFCDISECILMANGYIYQYVGDEVVVTWPLNRKTKPEDCLIAYLGCVKKIDRLKERYLAKYGVVPRFKVAFHLGEVIRGEIGNIKTELVFHGDVVNTTSRMERLCSEMNEPMLLSYDLFVMLPDRIKDCFKSASESKLKGREHVLEIFTLKHLPVSEPGHVLHQSELADTAW